MHCSAVNRRSPARPCFADYIKATVGFEKLGERRSTSKSLIRMFGPRGNPQAKICSA